MMSENRITESAILTEVRPDMVFIARCYAERAYATVYCLSVRLPVTFRYRDHIYRLEIF